MTDFRTSDFCRLKKFENPVFLLSLFFWQVLAEKKQKLEKRTLKEKCAALKELGKGHSHKDVTANYFLSNSILSKWVKSKALRAAVRLSLLLRHFDKMLLDTKYKKEGNNIKRHKINKVNDDSVDKAVFK